MSYRDCLQCNRDGTTPRRGRLTTIVYDPQITMPGPPILSGHRLGAEFMAKRIWRFGIAETMRDYELSREECLVVCWWAGSYGPRSLKKHFEAWAALAGRHLWFGCTTIDDPPMLYIATP